MTTKMNTPILITVPKYVAISPSPAPSLVSSDRQCDVVELDQQLKNRKRRLDHLSWEEKLQRKKLKNRVAAQTSRDRKKAKMDEMEHTINLLSQKTDLLQNKCDSLQTTNESLLNKNRKLDQQVEDLQKQLDDLKNRDKHQQQQNDLSTLAQNSLLKSDCVDSNSINLHRSAVSNYPLPKGMESQSTQYGYKDNSAALWKIIALCLLYKTCSKISIQANWKNSPKAYLPKSQKTWKAALQHAATMLPKMKAVHSNSLDQWWGPQQKSWNPAKIVVSA